MDECLIAFLSPPYRVAGRLPNEASKTSDYGSTPYDPAKVVESIWEVQMENKKCNRCGEEKPVDDFNWRRKKKNQRQSYCKKCQSKYTMESYKEDPLPYYERNFARKREQKKKILTYLLNHPCIKCGEKDPVVLDFDHRDRKSKVAPISHMIAHGYCWETVEAEVAKCDVLCSKCHRKKTAAESGWQALVNELVAEIKNAA